MEQVIACKLIIRQTAGLKVGPRLGVIAYLICWQSRDIQTPPTWSFQDMLPFRNQYIKIANTVQPTSNVHKLGLFGCRINLPCSQLSSIEALRSPENPHIAELWHTPSLIYKGHLKFPSSPVLYDLAKFGLILSTICPLIFLSILVTYTNFYQYLDYAVKRISNTTCFKEK